MPNDQAGEGLKPCPFCGGVATLVRPTGLRTDFNIDCYSVRCRVRPMTTGFPYPTVEVAWNARPIEDALSAELASLRLALKAAEEERALFQAQSDIDTMAFEAALDQNRKLKSELKAAQEAGEADRREVDRLLQDHYWQHKEATCDDCERYRSILAARAKGEGSNG